MFREQVVPRLAAASFTRARMYHRELRVTGLGESHVDQPGRARLHALSRSADHGAGVAGRSANSSAHVDRGCAACAKATFADIERGLDLALTDRIFSRDGSPLEVVVAHELLKQNATIAAAESCTGGLFAERLTTIAGSSAYFLGGVVCYSNEMKTAWADVPPEMIATKGAVSPEVAIALAEGIRRRVGSTLGIGITGIAGPGGGSEEKPVGTVHIASGQCDRRARTRAAFARRPRNGAAAGFPGRAGHGAHPFSVQRPGAAETGVRRCACSWRLSIPGDVRENLSSLIRTLRSADARPKWVRSENLHVTLKFIGEIDSEKSLALGHALAAVRSTQPVNLEFRGVGFFPNQRRPSVLWAGVHGSPNLAVAGG